MSIFLCVCMFTGCIFGAFGIQKADLDSLELESQVVVSHHMGVNLDHLQEYSVFITSQQSLQLPVHQLLKVRVAGHGGACL